MLDSSVCKMNLSIVVNLIIWIPLLVENAAASLKTYEIPNDCKSGEGLNIVLGAAVDSEIILNGNAWCFQYINEDLFIGDIRKLPTAIKDSNGKERNSYFTKSEQKLFTCLTEDSVAFLCMKRTFESTEAMKFNSIQYYPDTVTVNHEIVNTKEPTGEKNCWGRDIKNTVSKLKLQVTEITYRDHKDFFKIMRKGANLKIEKFYDEEEVRKSFGINE